jgi:hypothetical protein
LILSIGSRRSRITTEKIADNVALKASREDDWRVDDVMSEAISSIAKMGINLPTSSIVTNCSLIKRNENAVRKFIRGFVETCTMANSTRVQYSGHAKVSAQQRSRDV